MKFRKKPVVIEAWPVRELLSEARTTWNLPPDVKRAYEAGNVLFFRTTIQIATLEGWMVADVDDWIIRGVKGELYPCSPDIFAVTYEPVDTFDERNVDTAGMTQTGEEAEHD